jgi:hypothetical protein
MGPYSFDRIKPHNRPDLGSLAAPPGDTRCVARIDPCCGIIELSGVLGPKGIAAAWVTYFSG